mmetsp:Transcript_30467/g.77734  ORF Transcript_30467/g.77734 Transcript_30467/m.77734 type:complete len:220 (+) Transcript_30467:466-1125(+)
MLLSRCAALVLRCWRMSCASLHSSSSTPASTAPTPAACASPMTTSSSTACSFTTTSAALAPSNSTSSWWLLKCLKDSTMVSNGASARLAELCSASSCVLGWADWADWLVSAGMAWLGVACPSSDSTSASALRTMSCSDCHSCSTVVNHAWYSTMSGAFRRLMRVALCRRARILRASAHTMPMLEPSASIPDDMWSNDIWPAGPTTTAWLPSGMAPARVV